MLATQVRSEPRQPLVDVDDVQPLNEQDQDSSVNSTRFSSVTVLFRGSASRSYTSILIWPTMRSSWSVLKKNGVGSSSRP